MLSEDRGRTWSGGFVIRDDAANWTELFRSEQGGELLTGVELPHAVKARYLRLYITAGGEGGRQVGVREIVIQ